MTTKTCTKCGEVKTLENFRLTNKEKNWRVNNCGQCVALYKKEWGVKNKDKIAASNLKNKELRRARASTEEYRKKANEARRRNRKKNPIAHREEVAAWQKNNRPLVDKIKHKWRLNNSEKCKESQRRKCANLIDSYVASRLGMKVAQAPKDLIELKREQIITIRLTKQLTNIIKEKSNGS